MCVCRTFSFFFSKNKVFFASSAKVVTLATVTTTGCAPWPLKSPCLRQPRFMIAFSRAFHDCPTEGFVVSALPAKAQNAYLKLNKRSIVFRCSIQRSTVVEIAIVAKYAEGNTLSRWIWLRCLLLSSIALATNYTPLRYIKFPMQSALVQIRNRKSPRPFLGEVTR